MRAFSGFSIGTAIAIALGLVWQAIQRVVGDAAFGWLEDQIARAVHMTSPNAQTVIYWGMQFGPPIALTLLLLAGYHFWWTGWGQSKAHGLEGQPATALMPLPSISLARRFSGPYPLIFGLLIVVVAGASVSVLRQSSRPKAAPVQIQSLPVQKPRQPAKPGVPIYRVVVGSFLDREEALGKAREINSEDPSIKVFVADPPPCNDYFAVVASPFLSRADAAKALDNVAKLKTVQGKAYLSTRSNGECAKPSFLCTGDLNPDEWTICGDDHLAELDQTQNDSFGDFRSPSKREIGRKILAARRACETNKLCILDQQLFAIATFSGDGIDFPSWAADYRLRLYKELLNELETPPSQCAVTAISSISPDEIEFADKSYEVVPSYAPPIAASHVGDRILICTVSSCPLPFFEKKVYSATNLRTRDSWVLPNSTAVCGIE